MCGPTCCVENTYKVALNCFTRGVAENSSPALVHSESPLHALVIPSGHVVAITCSWPWRRKPVLIFGEPGLEKSNIAALVHFGSPAHAAPLVQARSRNHLPKACMPHLNYVGVE